MSRNFRCAVGVVIIWGLLILDFIFFIFMGSLFFDGISDMHYGWLDSGWDVRFERGISKMFISLAGVLVSLGIAAGFFKTEEWIYRWRAGK